MRDQWRADGDYKYFRSGGPRTLKDRRPTSPAAPQRDTELGLKIKGRANAESAPSSPRREVKRREEPLDRQIVKDTSHSPRRRKARDEERVNRPRNSSQERPEHTRHREESRITTKQGTRSRFQARGKSDLRDPGERRRSRSPTHLGRSDKFRPSSRRRERELSPPRSTRGDHYSSSYPEGNSLAGRFGDSYIPGRRRLSPSAENSSYRRRSRSKDRYKRPRTSTSHRFRSPDRGSNRHRESKASLYRQSPERSEPRPVKGSHQPRRSTPATVRAGSRGRERSDRYPLSSSYRDEIRQPSKKKMQQSPTRPIQSILDSHSRAPSPPRRIPSFDSQNQSPSANLNNTFPMHGMKAANVSGSHRPNRPPQLNTQNSYGTSPQWTPTSSHHGSPHSGSPFNQARSGWNAQPHQYQHQSK